MTPTITSIAPSTIPAGSPSTAVTITGTGFVAGSIVHVNGAVRATTFVSATQLRATLTPADCAAAAALSLSVLNPSETSNASAIAVTAPPPVAGPPRINTLSPNPVQVGAPAQSVTINGTGFIPSCTISYAGSERAGAYVSPTQLRVQLQAADLARAGNYAIVVTNWTASGGQSSNSAGLQVVTAPPPANVPTLVLMVPSSATVGSPNLTLTLTGTNFSPTSLAQWNGANLATTVLSNTQMTALLPGSLLAAPTPGQVRVITPGVGTSNELTFSVTSAPPPNTIDTLPPGQWMQVQSQLGSVLPSPVPPGNPEGIVNAWSGGAYDAVHDRLLVWGGGHGDYGGNEVYAFSIASMVWSRVWGPSPNIPDPLTVPVCVDTYADGNPVSRHSYAGVQYLPALDQFWIQGGSKACQGGSPGMDTWTLGESWTRKADIPTTMNGIISAYDPVTGHVFVQSSQYLYEYDPVADTWAARGYISIALSEDRVRNGAIDPETRMFVIMGDADFFAWDLRTFALLTPATSGSTEIQSGRAPGLVYDPVSKRLIAWMGGATVYSLDTTTWTWTRIDPAPANTVTPTAASPTGTYGRFQYIPSKQACIVLSGIWENVYVYKLPVAAGTFPLKQWVALPAPPEWSPHGLPYVNKHVTPSYHSRSGRVYFTGGDYAGPSSGSSGTTDSYRQETWSLSIAEKLAKPSDLYAGWRLEYPYCGPVGQIQPKHPDYVGFPWDDSRGVFYMVPGVMDSVTQGDCPGETGDKASDPGFIYNRMMTFDPVAKLWAVLGSGDAGNSQDTWMSAYDPVTDTLIRFGMDMRVNSFDCKTLVWSIATLSPANLWKEYLAADIPSRVIYAIDGLLGRLWRYHIDTRTFDDLGSVPGGLGYTNQTYIAWDSHSRRLFWHKEGAAFYAYDPDARTWETLSIATSITGVNATGRLICYDPQQNVILLYGGTVDPKPYLFFYRYSN